MAHLLQGLEAAFVHKLARVTGKVCAFEHDGAVISGELSARVLNTVMDKYEAEYGIRLELVKKDFC